MLWRGRLRGRRDGGYVRAGEAPTEGQVQYLQNPETNRILTEAQLLNGLDSALLYTISAQSRTLGNNVVRIDIKKAVKKE
jgi:hypothetical protein